MQKGDKAKVRGDIAPIGDGSYYAGQFGIIVHTELWPYPGGEMHYLRFDDGTQCGFYVCELEEA